MDKPVALVVDEEPAVRGLLREILEERGLEAVGASDEAEGRELLRSRRVALAVVDADRLRVDAWRATERDDPHAIPLWLALTRNGSAGRIRALVESGAFDVVTKPLEREAIEMAVVRALRQRKLLDELLRLRGEAALQDGVSGLVGRSAAIETVRERLRRLAASDESVWFVGEEGSGRELAARTLHATSARKDGPFVVVPCAGLSDAEWAARWREDAAGLGLLERAAHGSILLKQLPRLTPSQQESLVRRFERLSASSRPRMLASSSVEPRQAVEQGRLLEEVARRLDAQVVLLPALRERREDVAVLARHFAGQICRINDLPPVDLAPSARDALESYGWPGNVRELRTVIEQALILVQGGTLHVHDLPERIRAVAPPPGDTATRSLSSRTFRDAKREIVESFERAYLTDLLEHHEGNVTAASQHAGMLRSALQRLLRKYAIRSAEFRRNRRTRVERTASGPRPE
jgi:DNA-binding NtrC family response regulator